MYFCKVLELDKMFGRFSEVLQTAADVIAPPPSALQDFEYHWKQVKHFYSNDKTLPRVHINDTNIPTHLEHMLQILIKSEQDLLTKENDAYNQPKEGSKPKQKTDCLNFILMNRPLDLLIELAVNDCPPGAKICVLNWIRRYLSCLEYPSLHHVSVYQPIHKLISICNGQFATPYEEEEILFLETVAGLIRKDAYLLNIFLPSHQHTAEMMMNNRKGFVSSKIPRNNPLFASSKIEPNVRRISLVGETRETITEEESVDNKQSGSDKCDCSNDDSFNIFDAIISYFDSADSTIIVRACESALILSSLPTLNIECKLIKSTLLRFSELLANKLNMLCQRIPEDMDQGDIEECNIVWGLIPRDAEQQHYIGRYQLQSFLCWLDYCDCLAKECSQMPPEYGEMIRQQLFEGYVEPCLLDINASFMLVLTSKIVKQLQSNILLNELAVWLTGAKTINDINGSDCLLTILIENAQDNSDILLPTLQFIESLLENPNEQILHGMIFYYINNRGYFDNAAETVQSWSDEEENRERRRGSADAPVKSRTLAPNNILKVINQFLLLIPRQIMSEEVGTCYEEYMQDASRHYQLWIKKTKPFSWPIEAVWSDHADSPTKLSPSSSTMSRSSKNRPEDMQCHDSGISEGTFYEGPLLRMLFNHVKNMTTQPYELNLAVIAILSKLAMLPHPYLHEILLSPEIPVASGASTLWSCMQSLSRQLLSEIPRIPEFQKKISKIGKRLLTNPPLMKTTCDENTTKDGEGDAEDSDDDDDPLFESIIVLEEFCKELAAIAFVKYHHATE